jgi:hypothetical protein
MSKILGVSLLALSIGLAGCATVSQDIQNIANNVTLAQLESDAVTLAQATCSISPDIADIGTMVAKGGLAVTLATVSTVVDILCGTTVASAAARRYGAALTAAGAEVVTLPNGAVVTVRLAPLASRRYRRH